MTRIISNRLFSSCVCSLGLLWACGGSPFPFPLQSLRFKNFTKLLHQHWVLTSITGVVPAQWLRCSIKNRGRADAAINYSTQQTQNETTGINTAKKLSARRHKLICHLIVFRLEVLLTKIVQKSFCNCASGSQSVREGDWAPDNCSHVATKRKKIK